ncbi:MAG: NADH:ubiquinone oxidoreductase [Rikenellaceae bacterium]|nr:NADH:ubiquinone oxidoreductase [Rikenellaceae bacterium]
MFMSKFKVLRSHGKQFIPDLNAVTLPPIFRGRPSLDARTDEATRRALERLCPVGAITAEPFSLDTGRCLFCKECAMAHPDAVSFTNNYKMGSNDRRALVVTPGTDTTPFEADAVRERICSYFGHALRLRQVSAGGDGSTEMELNATGNVNFDFGRYGIEFTASPRHADGVVITGPITRNMAEALEICYRAIAEPKLIILAGSEAISGGLFAENRAIDRSFLATRTPDLLLPGNPVHPMTFIDGVMTLTGRKKRE